MKNFFSLSMSHVIFGISTQKFIYGLSDIQPNWASHIFSCKIWWSQLYLKSNPIYNPALMDDILESGFCKSFLTSWCYFCVSH